MPNFKQLWQRGMSYDDFQRGAEQNTGLWKGVYRKASIPDWAAERLSRIGSEFKVLVLAEDWCGDAANTVPVLAKLGSEIENVETRILKRDENPELMDRYLTNGSRSIPIAILLDSVFEEIGYWGPRPRELQQWVMDNKDTIPKEERYPLVRRWYAQDKGESTLKELLDLLG